MVCVVWGDFIVCFGCDFFFLFVFCWLCLEFVIDLVVCINGDLFCCECVLSNIFV